MPIGHAWSRMSLGASPHLDPPTFVYFVLPAASDLCNNPNLAFDRALWSEPIKAAFDKFISFFYHYGHLINVLAMIGGHNL